MKSWRKVLVRTLVVALLGLLWAGYKLALGHPFTINQLANRQALLYLLRSPELLTGLGVVEGTWLDRHSGKLAPVGPAAREADYAFFEDALAEVQRFDRARLSPQDQITYDILVDQWGNGLASRRFTWLSSEGLYPIAPMWGTQVGLATFMQVNHVVSNARTARNYVERLKAMGPKLDAVTAEMQRQAEAGVVLPAALLDRSVAMIRDTTAGPPERNPLVTTFVERMKSAEGLPAAEQAALRTAAIEVVRDGVLPAYGRMVAALEAVRPRALQQAAGVGRLADGAEYYALMLRQMTSTDYTPDQVHQLGLSEVTRIGAEMDALLRAQGLAEGTVAERVQQLRRDPRYVLPNTDEGRREVLARYTRMLEEVNARMPRYFAVLPQQPLVVERVPPTAEKGSAAAYYEPPALDGSRPGKFFANLRDVGEMPTWAMKTLAYHEGIPGHHFQIAQAQTLEGLPFIRQQTLYSAYAEGWALYAERLAAEIGMYRDDPLGDLGRLQAEMFRAVRLVVDTGMHARGWSREEAIAYMVGNTGMDEAAVTTEIERYMGLPGQACAYKVGQLKILELRERARRTLGARFDLKEFHRVVLGSGGVPLTVLERLVDEWIAARGSAATAPAGAG
jgi:uncharacterized protein (DUF885 family)